MERQEYRKFVIIDDEVEQKPQQEFLINVEQTNLPLPKKVLDQLRLTNEDRVAITLTPYCIILSPQYNGVKINKWNGVGTGCIPIGMLRRQITKATGNPYFIPIGICKCIVDYEHTRIIIKPNK